VTGTQANPQGDLVPKHREGGDGVFMGHGLSAVGEQAQSARVREAYSNTKRGEKVILSFEA